MDEALCPSCQEIVDVVHQDGGDGFCLDCDRCRECCMAAPSEACDYMLDLDQEGEEVPLFI